MRTRAYNMQEYLYKFINFVPVPGLREGVERPQPAISCRVDLSDPHNNAALAKVALSILRLRTRGPLAMEIVGSQGSQPIGAPHNPRLYYPPRLLPRPTGIPRITVLR